MTFVAAAALGGALAGTQALAVPYPAMAPLADYLMADPAAEAALARSAAPASISGAATVLVLEKGGYKTVTKGTNGFVCLVERAWMSAFDSPDFWDPKSRGPVCYNPAAARSILPVTIKRTSLVLAGKSKPQMLAELKDAVAKKQLPRPEVGAMSFMMSHQQAIGPHDGPWMPHLMFYTPTAGAGAWGANLKGSPVILNDSQTVVPEAETIFMIPAGKWSDGAPYVGEHAHSH